MRDLDWDRTSCITAVRDRVWSYLSPASQFEGPGLLVAGALLQWPQAEAARLGELQFLLCHEVGDFLDDLPQLMRKLTTTSDREEELSTQRIRGPVDWGHTLSMRSAAGSSDLYVTAPPRRAYQTPENELLIHVLDAIARGAQHSGWAKETHRREPARLIRKRLAEATHAQRNRQISSIDRVAPTPRGITRIRSGRNAQRYASVINAYDKLVALVEQMDRNAVREAVEGAGLVTAEGSILFELLTAFQVIDALKAADWSMESFTLFAGHVYTTGSKPDGRQLRFWYQATPNDLAASSQYMDVLTDHAFTRSRPLRPDIVLQWTNPGSDQRWLLIECKLITSQVRAVSTAARQALADLLLYRRDFDAVLGHGHGPYGLGVAWGEGLQPNLTSDIMLCTLDTLSHAISQTVI